MIAKIVKGSGFREVTRYIIDSKKDARIIAHAGLFIEDVNTITKAFEAQAGMNPKVSRHESESIQTGRTHCTGIFQRG